MESVDQSSENWETLWAAFWFDDTEMEKKYWSPVLERWGTSTLYCFELLVFNDQSKFCLIIDWHFILTQTISWHITHNISGSRSVDSFL